MRTLLALLLIVAPADDKYYFPVKKGLKWTYTVDDKEIVATVAGKDKIGDNEVAVVEKTWDGGSAKEYFGVTDKGVFLYKVEGDQTIEFKDNPVPRVKFGTKKGDSWEWKTEGQEGKYENLGEEEIEVAAGKYKTLKIQVNATGNGNTYKVTRWYASGVGLVKEESTAGGNTRTMELKKFEEEKEKPKDKEKDKDK